MRSGPLRHRCVLQEEQQQPDGMGGHSREWVEIRKVWAQVGMPTGRVASIAQQITPVVTAEIRCRPSPDFIAGRRLIHQGTAYRIEAVLPDNKNSMMRLLCSSVAHP